MNHKTTDILTGRYQGDRRGFGFFTPEGATGRGEDCFVPPHKELGAWDGDLVEVRVLPADPAQPGRRLAHVTKILERANATVTGTIQKINRQMWLVPDSSRLSSPIKVVGKVKLRDGEKAAVGVTGYGTAATPPLGQLKATFGPSGTREAAVEAILYQQGVDRLFPEEVVAAAKAAPSSVPPEALAGRLDLREKTIITIDGAASKDLDDAISLEKAGENWVLGVHIADVSHYVTPGSPLDAEALHRGTSVYFADRVVPMLPVELSNGICSLNEGVDRLTLSCFMTLSPAGEVTDHTIVQSVIRSTHRMTYEDCNILLAGEGDRYPTLARQYAHILPMLRDMAALSRVLEKRRKARGSLDLETQESYILCDNEGRPVAILPRHQGESEKLIESFMLSANETVARHLLDAAFPGVYRVHEKPSQDKTDTLRAMLSPLGIPLKDTSHGALQKVLDSVKGKPEAPAVSMMILRSMMKARYDTENLGHFGLAADHYCHFTSPIRRYPDLMVHRCLHSLLDGRKGEKGLKKSCAEAAKQSSQREIAAQTAERDIDKLYFADYMHKHIGEEFPAAVSGVTRFGLFAALPNGVEGLVPVETLPSDHYEYDELRMTLTGERTGTVYSFGMALSVVCVAADPSTGRVDFRLPGQEEAPAREEHHRPRQPGGSGKKGPGKAPGKKRAGRPAMHVPKRGKKGKRR